eukprot:jgi/Botrbrau1/20475/Bobra.145_2s0035.1
MRKMCRNRLQLVLMLVVASSAAPVPAALDTSKEQLGKIPRIIHQFFWDGEEEYQRVTSNRTSKLKASWRDSCKKLHPDWQYMWWDLATARSFLQQHYPWFLSTFDAYPFPVSKGDAVRPFLLHHYGGVYLDLDCECLQPMDGFIRNYDLVLQGVGGMSTANSVMASAPQHAFWKVLWRLLTEKARIFKTGSPAPEKSIHDAHLVLMTSGPRVLDMAFEHFAGSVLHGKDSVAGEWLVGESVARVYAMGEWFYPCKWFDRGCRKIITENAEKGIVPAFVAGHHHDAATWINNA